MAEIVAGVRQLSDEMEMSENGSHEMGLETEYATLDAGAPEQPAAAARFETFAREACEQAESIRRLLAGADDRTG